MSESFSFDVASHGSSTARVYRAREPVHATLILGHGAGTSQTHPFMLDVVDRLTARGVDVVTFNFLYMERGKRLPDRTDVLEACWHAVLASVRARLGLPASRVFCGGKSMGGRIASHLAVAPECPPIEGLVFLGYPLHPSKKPHLLRDAHLPRVPCRMLFVQGSRDELGDEREIRELAGRLPRASVHVVAGGDHSLGLLKREGATRQEKVLDEAAEAIARFIRGRVRGRKGKLAARRVL